MTDAGWRRYESDPGIAAWAHHAAGHATDILADPVQAHWYRCRRTWFAGVDCLPNDETGRLPGGPPLQGQVIDDVPGDLALHKAQVSAVFPGYPQAKEGESAAAARYRIKRDAAHVDGLLPVGPDRMRMIREPHAFILGLPLTDAPRDASPLVVWEGSHRLMQEAFRSVLEPAPVEKWSDIDLTAVYHAARRTAFERCRRVEVPAGPGEAVLLHPMLLHGISPWRAEAGPPRIVAYFRPQIPVRRWLGVGAEPGHPFPPMDTSQ